MKMAKPERHPWPYGPQWNYYPPPPVLSLPKIPLPSGPQINSEYNENYLGIRCPEPRRPYQVPCSTFGSYYHQDTHPVGSYIQSTPLYPPKQYVHRPIPHENFNNTYKYNENIHNYPAYPNNFSSAKDETNCYQNPWTNTSQCQRKPPELDVRRFLATWQEKDDDFVEGSSESEEHKVCQGYDPASLPLDCTKRSSSEKPIKRSYENFVTGQASNAAGCVVQPYCIKDNVSSLNRSVIATGELNNNIPQRNNLNYGNAESQSYHNKNVYSNSDYWKNTSEKFMSCEHSFPYTQQLNHCDINVNNLRSNISYRREKDNILDSSERSQYNLTSSLESGDLFSDINSRNEDHQKQSIVHPLFSDVAHHRGLNCDEQPYFGHDNNDYSENLVYTDLHSMKEPWELFPPSLKRKGNIKVDEKQKSPVCKLSAHSDFEQSSVNTNAGSVMYEGAFNILPNLNDTSLPLNTVNSAIQYNNNCNNVSSSDGKSPPMPRPLVPNKLSPNIPKCGQNNSKIKPYQFSEEVSSDDIDISIASSGDLIVDDDHSSIAPISVINFSRTKKEKLSKPPLKINKECPEVKNIDNYSEPIFTNTVKSTLIAEENKVCESINNDMVHNITKLECSNKETPKDEEASSQNCVLDSQQTLKPDVMDLTVLKPQNLQEEIPLTPKQEADYLDLPNNYFGSTDFVEDKKADELIASVTRCEAVPYQDQRPPSIEHSPSFHDKNNTITAISEIINSESVHQLSIKKEDNLNPISPNDDFVKVGRISPTLVKSFSLDDAPSSDNTSFFINDNLNGDIRDADNHENTPSLFTDPPNENKSFESSTFTENSRSFTTNDNLLLLAHCSQAYGSQIGKEVQSLKTNKNEKIKSLDDTEKISKPLRDSVIKCSLRWDKIFNVMSDEDNVQPDMALDLGPAKVELRMPPESCSSGQWKVVEADNKVQTSSIVQVKRLILKRKSQSEERIPKMVIKKTDNQEYRSYLKKEPNEAVLNCGKFKIYYDISSKSKFQKSIQCDDSGQNRNIHTDLP